jgi:hypothetical protein
MFQISRREEGGFKGKIKGKGRCSDSRGDAKSGLKKGGRRGRLPKGGPGRGARFDGQGRGGRKGCKDIVQGKWMEFDSPREGKGAWGLHRDEGEGAPRTVQGETDGFQYQV